MSDKVTRQAAAPAKAQGQRLIDLSPPTANAPMELRSLVLEHPALAVSAVTSLFLIVKLLAVSDWNMTTTLALVAVADTAKTVLGGVIVTLPYAVLCLVVGLWPRLLALFRRNTAAERSAAIFAFGIPGVIAGLLIVYTEPWLNLAAALVVVVVMIATALVMRRRSRMKAVAAEGDKSPPPDDVVSAFERAASLVGFVLIIVWQTLSTPWFPLQAIQVGEGDPVAGYVVAADAHTVSVLSATHAVLTQHSADEVSYSVCMRTDWSALSLMEVITGPRYPACPK